MSDLVFYKWVEDDDSHDPGMIKVAPLHDVLTDDSSDIWSTSLVVIIDNQTFHITYYLC